MKDRVLFVDDDPNILHGLRRNLRSMRHEWDAAFATSGEEALRLHQEDPFDIVISDMRMPNMDGACLLSKIRKQTPNSVRIILSGFSEEESILRTVGPAHQYLAKPCESGDIIQTVKRARALRGYLHKTDVQSLVAGLEHLKAPSSIVLQLLNQLDDPNVSIDQIADTINQDACLVAQTLKLTNSAFFTLPQKVDSIRSAVSLLGTETLKSLVVIAGFFKSFEGSEKAQNQLSRISRDSLQIGTVARRIAQAENLPSASISQAQIAGLLSNIGQIVIVSEWYDKFEAARRVQETQGMTPIDAERHILGVSHPEISAYLLGLWGFTDPIVEAAASHHAPWFYWRESGMSVSMCVYIAQLLVPLTGTDTSFETACQNDADLQHLIDLNLGEKLSVWWQIAEQTHKQA